MYDKAGKQLLESLGIDSRKVVKAIIEIQPNQPPRVTVQYLVKPKSAVKASGTIKKEYLLVETKSDIQADNSGPWVCNMDDCECGLSEWSGN